MTYRTSDSLFRKSVADFSCKAASLMKSAECIRPYLPLNLGRKDETQGFEKTAIISDYFSY